MGALRQKNSGCPEKKNGEPLSGEKTLLRDSRSLNVRVMGQRGTVWKKKKIFHQAQPLKEGLGAGGT